MNRKAHWDEVYSNKSPLEVSWYQKEPALSLQLIDNTGISTDAAIIDIGGGASTLVDHLNERDYKHLAILDISGNALAYAKERLASAADEIEWFESDITTFQSPHQFDLWQYVVFDCNLLLVLGSMNEQEIYDRATNGMNEKARYKLANYCAHGYEVVDGDVTILRNKNLYIIIDTEGNIYGAERMIG